MKIGILGGSFDPPHIGHLLVARQTREVAKLDQVWLMPYFGHNWDTTVTPANHRFTMTKLLEEDGIKTSDEEIKREEKSYTIDTVRRLKSKFSSHEFFWIVGSDVLPEFNRWKNYEKLQKEVSFLVFPRNGHPLPDRLLQGFAAVIAPELVTSNISSTIVRKRITKSLSVSGMIPQKVLAYIKKNSLYTQTSSI
ncbi:nicotinate (nicotinamide) nucleotide adenylyltransferase [Candidatus Gottesmanbacteria bacterium]|nr:nicotinate (nicotinamide) nucleotide adenylyltransferase [Candidatus Gottesmanbacteria bacterium]